MDFLNLLMGMDTSSLGDPELASDLLKDSKFAVISLGRAVTEVTNPDLKESLIIQLTEAIDQHHQLSDWMIQKNWYHPYLTPQEQVANDLQRAESMS